MIDRQIVQAIGTDSQVGSFFMEVPSDAPKPYFLFEPMPSSEFTGDLKDPNSLADIMFQVSVVGETQDQAVAAADRLVNSVKETWRDVADVTGPPTLRRNGGSRQDDRTYRFIFITIYKIGVP